MSQSWEEYVAGLTPAQRDHMLHELLKWQIEDLGVDGDVKFLAAEAQKDFADDKMAFSGGSAEADIYWASCGESLVPAAEPVETQAAPAETETVVAVVNNVKVMVNASKGIGLLCRSVQLVSTPTHPYFKSAVIFNHLIGPRDIISSFIESLQTPNGRPSVLMHCAAGLLRVLDNVKATEISMSASSDDVTIFERVTALSTTALELKTNHDRPRDGAASVPEA